MAQANERLNHPISTAELERRWAAVRAAMNDHRIDALLMQSNNDWMGGYVKYFTDVPATNGYPVTVVFPKDDRMTVIGQGPMGVVREFPPQGDSVRRGTARFVGMPSYASCPYTADYDAELAAKALERYSGGTIGFLGRAAMSFALGDFLAKQFTRAKFVDASDMIDLIKAVKSPEERERIRETAAMQDKAMEETFAAIRPGMRELEVAAIAEHIGHRHGSEQGLFLAGSGPVGTAAVFANRYQQNRMLREGDQFTLLIENNGPGGFYTELGRTCVLGKASQEMKDEFAFVLEAQKFTLDRMKPGARCSEIFAEYNAFMRKHGRPEEKRLHSHGQGYDMVERPLIRHDETMTIHIDMNMVCHPTYVTERTYSWCCDNFLIGDSGVAEKLHKFPQKIFELG
ncbi:MAG TPA: M24 family metallopeptidase [Burkholderiales bacterium]|nr:M24 family metallopeptidase [Burkholderiales bacterium]